MSSIKITNKTVYTVPDSDSESDLEESLTLFTPTFSRKTEKQEKKLIELGCSFNILDDYKQSSLFKNPKTLNEDFETKLKNHQLKVQKQNELILKQQRERQQQEYERLQKMISEISLKNKVVDDKDFEEELKKQRKLIEEAIVYDKKKHEKQLEQEKLKAEKAKKEKEEEENKQKEKEQKEKEKEQKQKELKQKKEEALKMKQSAATSIEGLEEYKKHLSKIEFYKANIKPKLQQDTFRKQCFNAKRPINRTIAQLQSDHNIVLEKFNSLHTHLMSIKQSSQDAFEVMLNHLSKAFLAQVKQEIHANNHAAYFLARFAYLMCAAIPEFMDYLLGRLLKRCPYLIPRYFDDDPTIPQDEIKRLLRYVYSNKEKKTLETFLEHAEGQKCYVMFYGALCQTLPDPGQPENPYSIKHAWIWLARVSNMAPREITPVLVSGLLEVSGNRLLQAYPNQTPKLLRLIRETICPLYPITATKDNVASIRRLEMFLDDYFSTGKLDCLPEKPPTSLK